MINYWKAVFHVDVEKINIPKGIRQSILMFIPLFVCWLLGNISPGLMIAMGTLAHIYVFGGTLRSKLKTVVFATGTLSLAMFLGTLTADNHLLFGLLLFLFTVIPYYVCNTLDIKGPSSTFFLVAYGLSSIMPFDPSAAFYRGGLVLLGGLLVMLLVLIETYIVRKDLEQEHVKKEYELLIKLSDVYRDENKFNAVSAQLMQLLNHGTSLLGTRNPISEKNTAHYERMILLHHNAEGIYSEILELHAKRTDYIPEVISEMLIHLHKEIASGATEDQWKAAIDLPDEYNTLLRSIFRAEENFLAPESQIEKKIISRKPQYMNRLIQNFTPESVIFMWTLKYAAIMSVAITVALLFHFDRPYWIALTVHTIMLSNTTVGSLQRAGARLVGTLIGIGIVLLLLQWNPGMLIVILIIAIAGGVNEVLIASNYALAMISITTQVLLMSGLAAGHMSFAFAYLRIIDVSVGITITLIGILLLGRKTASVMLPRLMAKLIRTESQMFHHLFSKHQYHSSNTKDYDLLKLSQQVFNLKAAYQNASGELSGERHNIQYYYPAIFQLEKLSYNISRLIQNDESLVLDETVMGEYLNTFENIAKSFEYENTPLRMTTLTPLERYNTIRRSLEELQNIQMKDNQ